MAETRKKGWDPKLEKRNQILCAAITKIASVMTGHTPSWVGSPEEAYFGLLG